MLNIKRFVLHVVKTQSDNPNVIVKKREISMCLKPSVATNVLLMKKMVAEKLSRERDKGWSYWYVVVEIEANRADKTAYRTIIGKTMF